MGGKRDWGGLVESRGRVKFSYLPLGYLFPQISEEASTVKHDCTHKSLTNLSSTRKFI